MSLLGEDCAGSGFEALDFAPAPSTGGGSCSTGRGVVCARAEDASLEWTGSAGELLDGAGVARGVELLDSGLAVVLRVEDDDLDGSDELVEDELESAWRLELPGELRSQSSLPLEAAFGGSWQ